MVGLIGLDLAYRCWRESVSPGSAKILSLLRQWLGLAAGVGLLLVPYVLFHLQATGQPLPNTFYAKQAEYRVILHNFPLGWRLFGNLGPPVESVQGVFRVIFIGAQLLLLPGLGWAAWLTLKERHTLLMPMWLWWIGYLLLYGLRLPVTYQHGRYQIPAIAWVILLGVWGTARLVQPPQGSRRWPAAGRIAGRALLVSLGVLALAFLGLGAQAYGRDVRFIESEMVATAQWLNAHVEPDALIAAHDIGAIGYFTQRPLIDLAGLITPEIIPFIRNEAALFDFIRARRAGYLVTFPSWYAELSQQAALRLIYTTGAPWSRQAGGDNMAVYRINQP